MGSLGVTKRKFILPATLCLAETSVITKVGCRAVAPELIGSNLETVIALAALTSSRDVAGVDECEGG
jgi:hypothetical protein